jgi:hypothetical protein
MPMETTPNEPISTRNEFHDAVRRSLAEAAKVGCREIFLADVDFTDWPLSERAVIESLTSWAQSHRRLTLLATSFDEVPRRHARFTEWRRTWAHVVDCRVNEEIESAVMPRMLLAPGLLGLRLVDPIHYRGSVTHDAADLLRWRETLDEVLQRSEASFPATTLGL